MTDAARVDGVAIPISEIDRREAQLRAGTAAVALPAPGTGEGRQLRRWLTQLAVTEQVVAAEAARLGLTGERAPAEDDLLPDQTARLELGSVAAGALAQPVGRAVFARVTAGVTVSDAQVRAYYERNPLRFASSGESRGWRPAPVAPALAVVRTAIETHLLGVARRRAFRSWLDRRCAETAELASGFEHPGDPRQPDNVHRH